MQDAAATRRSCATQPARGLDGIGARALTESERWHSDGVQRKQRMGRGLDALVHVAAIMRRGWLEQGE